MNYFSLWALNPLLSLLDHGGVRTWKRVWLPVQDGAYWGFWRWEIQPAGQVHKEWVQSWILVHDWGWVRYEELDRGWQGHQGTDLGHSWPREVAFSFFIAALRNLLNMAVIGFPLAWLWFRSKLVIICFSDLYIICCSVSECIITDKWSYSSIVE